MNGLVLAISALLAVASAVPSGHIGAVVSGPSGVVTGHGAIGPVAVGHGLGLGLGLGHGAGAILTPPSAAAAISGPAHGAILAPAHGAVIAGPVAHGAVLGGHGLGLGLGLGLGHGLVAAPIAHGAGVITNGGGTIGVSAHGAAIRGPPTAPVVVAGPSGKVAADGLWGPTANVGLGHGHGHW